MSKKANDIVNINGCVVKAENGEALATIREEDGLLVVTRTASCSLGLYFYILSYLSDLGFEIK